MRKYIAASALMIAAAAQANVVLLDETFNDGSDWQASFPVWVDADNQPPAANVNPIFMDGNGVSRPWWRTKDATASTDGFLASHSIYTNPGKSNDWIQSKPIFIESEGFNLTFGAQSCPFRTGPTRLSDLWVFITEDVISEDNLPKEPTMYIEQVPVGEKTYDVEGDFIPYSLNLDAWVGKTVYICFANLNDDSDLLIIDDVKVERQDRASLAVATDAEVFTGTQYTTTGSVAVTATVTVAGDADALRDWAVTFFADGVKADEAKGESLAAGETRDFTFTCPVGVDSTVAYSVELSGTDIIPVIESGEVTGLGFRPYRRVLVEEATGMWCGNCPTGMYNIDCLSENEETREYAIPVSVHVPGSGYDYLVDTTYAGMLGINAAPAYRVNRDLTVRYFSLENDADFDPSRPNSMANLVRRQHEAVTVLDIDMEAEYLTEGADTTAVACRVKVTPARTLDTSRYRIGFIMKENNVFDGASPLMAQHNYLSGMTSLPTTVGGWTEMPEVVMGMHYNDVARGVWNYSGLDGSMPDAIEYGDTYTFDHTIEIPDTYYAEDLGGKTCVGNPAIKTDFVTMIAYVIDLDSRAIVNAVAVPMSDIAGFHYDNTGYFSAVEGIEADGTDAAPEYYNLQGLRVADPTAAGIYIVKRGSRVSKEMVR